MTTDRHNTDSSRRRFLSMVPFTAFAGMFATVSTTAIRFLSSVNVREKAAAAAKWLAVGPVSELSGSEPALRSLRIEQEAGWAIESKEEAVYVLPGNDHKVVSAVCPHEGCAVVWDASKSNFLCPCHDSRFSERGQHLSGPSNGDLAQVPSKVEAGVLSVRLDV